MSKLYYCSLYSSRFSNFDMRTSTRNAFRAFLLTAALLFSPVPLEAARDSHLGEVNEIRQDLVRRGRAVMAAADMIDQQRSPEKSKAAGEARRLVQTLAQSSMWTELGTRDAVRKKVVRGSLNGTMTLAEEKINDEQEKLNAEREKKRLQRWLSLRAAMEAKANRAIDESRQLDNRLAQLGCTSDAPTAARILIEKMKLTPAWSRLTMVQRNVPSDGEIAAIENVLGEWLNEANSKLNEAASIVKARSKAPQ
jgi:hypothetical protein